MNPSFLDHPVYIRNAGRKLHSGVGGFGPVTPPSPHSKVFGEALGHCPVYSRPTLQCKTVIWSGASPLTMSLRGSYAQPYIALQISYGIWRPASAYLRSETRCGWTENYKHIMHKFALSQVRTCAT